MSDDKMYNIERIIWKHRYISKLFKEKRVYRVSKSKFCNMTEKCKVLVTRKDVPGEAIDKLKSQCDVEIYPDKRPISKEDLVKRISGKDGLLCLLTDQVDKDVIDAAGEQLKVIATMSVGYEHIDLEECRKRKIQVSHTPDVSSDSVAEWTVMLMLNASRNFLQAATAIKKGEWKYSWRPLWLTGYGLKDAIVGIVGMGRIAEEMGAVYTEFDELCKKSDFVVCMCVLSEETKNLFNKKAFELMKPEAVFVNTSRGGVVNQDDLYDILKNNKIRAAAIDVTIPEPLPKDHKLTTLPNLIITPHLASAELNVRKVMADLAAENILLGLRGVPLRTPVPMPK